MANKKYSDRELKYYEMGAEAKGYRAAGWDLLNSAAELFKEEDDDAAIILRIYAKKYMKISTDIDEKAAEFKRELNEEEKEKANVPD